MSSPTRKGQAEAGNELGRLMQQKLPSVLRESMQQIAQLPADKPESGISAFNSFRTAVSRATGSGNDKEEFLDPLEPKGDVLVFLVGLHEKKKMYRKQIHVVFTALMQVNSWQQALREDEALVDRLPEELRKILDASSVPSSPSREVREEDEMARRAEEAIKAAEAAEAAMAAAEAQQAAVEAAAAPPPEARPVEPAAPAAETGQAAIRAAAEVVAAPQPEAVELAAAAAEAEMLAVQAAAEVAAAQPPDAPREALPAPAAAAAAEAVQAAFRASAEKVAALQSEAAEPTAPAARAEHVAAAAEPAAAAPRPEDDGPPARPSIMPGRGASALLQELRSGEVQSTVESAEDAEPAARPSIMPGRGVAGLLQGLRSGGVAGIAEEESSPPSAQEAAAREPAAVAPVLEGSGGAGAPQQRGQEDPSLLDRTVTASIDRSDHSTEAARLDVTAPASRASSKGPGSRDEPDVEERMIMEAKDSLDITMKADADSQSELIVFQTGSPTGRTKPGESPPRQLRLDAQDADPHGRPSIMPGARHGSSLAVPGSPGPGSPVGWLKEQSAATRIQSIHRGKQSRQRVRALREERVLAMREDSERQGIASAAASSACAAPTSGALPEQVPSVVCSMTIPSLAPELEKSEQPEEREEQDQQEEQNQQDEERRTSVMSTLACSIPIPDVPPPQEDPLGDTGVVAMPTPAPPVEADAGNAQRDPLADSDVVGTGSPMPPMRGAAEGCRQRNADSDTDSSEDRFMPMVGTQSIRQEASKMFSLRPLEPLSRVASEHEAEKIASSPAAQVSAQLSSASAKRNLVVPSNSGVAKNGQVQHKCSRSSFDDSDSDHSFVAELPTKPAERFFAAGGPRDADLGQAGSSKAPATRCMSLPVPKADPTRVPVRSVASVPAGAGERIFMHKQVTSGRRLAGTSSDLQALAKASLTLSSQDMQHVRSNNSIKAQVEAIKQAELEMQWNRAEREGGQAEQAAACGIDGCIIS